MARLQNKVAVITGAASGIGAAATRLFLAEGAKVAATDIDGRGLDKLATDIDSDALLTIAHDVARAEDWTSAVEATLRAFGRIDVLVNNAAVHHETSFADTSLEEWNRVLAVDLNGTFLGCKAIVPQMVAQGAGSIVNLASIAAMIGGSFAHYSAAKGAIRSFTRTLAIEYARHNVRANAVFPGLIETPLTQTVLADPDLRAKLAAATALPRFGKPEDIAYCLLYLASDESSFATGAEFVIDGGVTAQ